MTAHFVCNTAELIDPSVIVVTIDGKEIGVFRVEGELSALENRCLHQGGPVCEGTIMPKVTAEILPDRTLSVDRFSNEEFHIVCPWHGYEYNLKTGECAAQPALKLMSYDVFETDGQIFVEL